MKVDITELERDRTIDPGQLDVECVRQADLFFKWAERSIAAKSEADRADHDLKVLEARLQIECREDPDAFGIRSQATETAIKSAVLCSKRYTDGVERAIRARETYQVLSHAVSAMEQRKRMLEVLVTLHGQEYFAGPSVPRDLVSAWQEHQQAVTEGVNSRQGERTRKRVRRDK